MAATDKRFNDGGWRERHCMTFADDIRFEKDGEHELVIYTVTSDGLSATWDETERRWVN